MIKIVAYIKNPVNTAWPQQTATDRPSCHWGALAALILFNCSRPDADKYRSGLCKQIFKGEKRNKSSYFSIYRKWIAQSTFQRYMAKSSSVAEATVPGEAQTLSSNKTAKRLHLFSQSVRIAAQCSLISENTSERERVSERAKTSQRAVRQGRDGATDTVNNSDHQTSQFSLQFHLEPRRRLDETKPIDLSVLHLDPLTS